MAMMQVRPMSMGVFQFRMMVRMTVWFAWRVTRFMHMLVVLVVNMAMRVIENFMCVAVDVAFGEVEPGSQCHEQTGDHEDRRQWHAKDRRRRQRPDEGSCSVIGTGPRRPEMAKRHDEQHQPQPIAHKAKDHCASN